MSDGDRLRGVLARMFSVESGELADSSSPETVPAWDSMTHLDLVMALEDEFGIALSPAEILEMKTVGHIREILRGHGALP